jgi:hypothetical protein
VRTPKGPRCWLATCRNMTCSQHSNPKRCAKELQSLAWDGVRMLGCCVLAALGVFCSFHSAEHQLSLCKSPLEFVRDARHFASVSLCPRWAFAWNMLPRWAHPALHTNVAMPAYLRQAEVA